jgi:CDP-glucose 4,6-dehydratase
MVNVTSDKCYENWGKVEGYNEDDPMGGYDPYSSSKGCSELVTRAYIKSFFNSTEHRNTHKIAVASARAGNVIGGGDWAEDRLIPDIIRAYEAGKPLVIRYPEAVRPWQHVLEPLCGYMVLAKNLYEKGDKYSGAWNFGPKINDARPVSWLADFSEKVLNNTASWVKDELAKHHEEKYLFLDSSKAGSELGWSGVWNIEKALGATLVWYKTYFSGADMFDYSCSQIEEYVGEKAKNPDFTANER